MKRCNLFFAMFIIGIPAAVVVGLSLLRSYAQEAQQEPPMLNRGLARELNELMRRKLDNSQKVLEGIALSDFDAIAKHAEDLIAVSEQTQWRVLETPEYHLYSNDLRRNAETLIQKSKEKNLDGAVLAYVDLTLTCVKCHKHVRDAR